MEPSASKLLTELQRTQDMVVELRGDMLTTHDIASAVKQGMVDGAREIASDPDFAKVFWEKGYEQLSTHAGKGASLWVGKRILTWMATTVVVVLLAWLVRSGALK